MKTNCGFCCRIYAQQEKEEDEEKQQDEEEEGRATIARQSNCSKHKQQQVEEGPEYESKLGDLPENARNFFSAICSRHRRRLNWAWDLYISRIASSSQHRVL